MCETAIIDEVCSVEWDIVAEDRAGNEVPGKEKEVEIVQDFFYNPNTNKESWETIVRMMLPDLIEINSGIIVKIFNAFGKMVEVVARDGVAFTKNPDIYGMYTDRADLILIKDIMGDIEKTPGSNPYPFLTGYITADEAREEGAYFQYGFNTGAKPVPFGKREIVWFEKKVRTDDLYGRSAMEVLAKTVQTLIYAVEHNLEYFSDNSIPPGVLGMEGISTNDLKAFAQQWTESQKAQDDLGNWKKKFHKLAMVNRKPTFERLGFTNAELELIESQKWWSKLVWGCMGMTATELGFVEDSKGSANQIVQSSIAKKRIIYPLLRLIEYHVNTEIIPEFGFEGIQYKYKIFDVDEETKKWGLYKLQTEADLKTINEIRNTEGLDPVEWGDKNVGDRSPQLGTNINMTDPRQTESNRINSDNQDDRDKQTNKPKKKPEEKEFNDFLYGGMSDNVYKGFVNYLDDYYENPNLYDGLLNQIKNYKERISKTKIDIEQLSEQFYDKNANHQFSSKDYFAKRNYWNNSLSKNFSFVRECAQKNNCKICKSILYACKDDVENLYDFLNSKHWHILKSKIYDLAYGQKDIKDGSYRIQDMIREHVQHLQTFRLYPFSSYKDIDNDTLKTLRKVESKPMGPYKNFASCVRANQDKKDPEAYCGEIMARTEKALGTDSPLTLQPGEELSARKLKKGITKLLDENKKKIIEILETQKQDDQLIKIKGVDDIPDMIKKVFALFTFKGLSDRIIQAQFTGGWDTAEKTIDQNVEFNSKALQFLQDHTFDNIKDMTGEIANDLKAELSRGIINGEGINKLKKRVDKVFNVGENRAEMIARTEVNRAENNGKLLAMKGSGLDYDKKWVSAMDDRTSELCKHLDGQVVGLDENFHYKDWTGQSPPSHVNCRSAMVFIKKEE